MLSATLNGFINCSCNHLTSFGGALLIKPNPIDFDKVSVEFKSLQETGNVAVIVTISVVLLCFIFVQVIVRKADKEDARNVSNDDNTYCLFTPGVREVMGSIPVGDTECFFVPHSCLVDQFLFHISLPTLKFTIFISLLQSHGLFSLLCK